MFDRCSVYFWLGWVGLGCCWVGWVGGLVGLGLGVCWVGVGLGAALGTRNATHRASAER